MSPETAGPATARGLDPRWMAAALPSALALVGPEREAEIDLGDLDPPVILGALAPALDVAALERLVGSAADAGELLEAIAALGALGALVPASGSATGPATLPLAEALLAALDGRSLTGSGRLAVATADELLILPAGLTGEQERRALHAFVASMSPDLRQRAYCRVAAERLPVVRGDRPDPRASSAALAEHDVVAERDVVVVDLVTGGKQTVTAERLDELGFDRPHRLGPLIAVGPLARAERTDATMHVFAARYALANLRFAEPAENRAGGGRASDPTLAETIARAEAAERHASGDLGRHEVVRAAEETLDAPAISPVALFRSNDRQLRSVPSGEIAYDPTAPHLWVAGRSARGERRWVAADAVFFPFHDPVRGGRTLPTTSSGAAAHTTLEEARLRALCEVVERDAFMWTWVQRVERETLDERSLPTALRDRAAAVRERGLSIAFVNLTLELLPVVACAIYSGERLGLTVACSPDPSAAAARAFDEGVGLVDVIDRGRMDRVAAEQVVTPAQHAALYLDPDRVEGARFLFSSSDRVALDDIAQPDAKPLEIVSERHEIVTVDLTTPATAPFHVARVIVPDLVPVSFGYDREPLGMERLAGPQRTHDGRVLGARLDLSEAGPLDPHPFA